MAQDSGWQLPGITTSGATSYEVALTNGEGQQVCYGFTVGLVGAGLPVAGRIASEPGIPTTECLSGDGQI